MSDKDSQIASLTGEVEYLREEIGYLRFENDVLKDERDDAWRKLNATLPKGTRLMVAKTHSPEGWHIVASDEKMNVVEKT